VALRINNVILNEDIFKKNIILNLYEVMDKDQSDHWSNLAEELEELRQQLIELNAHATVKHPVQR